MDAPRWTSQTASAAWLPDNVNLLAQKGLSVGSGVMHNGAEPMVGNLNIRDLTEAVRQLFIAFEKDARKLKPCCFCGSKWQTIKLAAHGHLGHGHAAECAFAQLGKAGENAIIAEREGGQEELGQAGAELEEKIDILFSSLTEEVAPGCLFPVCKYRHALGHRVNCPFNHLKLARARSRTRLSA